MPHNTSDNARDAHTDFAHAMDYADYLSLESICSAQHPLSSAHDETLFIIQHQTSELWMRLILHELESVRELIANKDLQPAFKLLTRVARVFEQLNSAWDIMRTMTPSDYTEFRSSLGKSSGFQSWQYRMVEYCLGNRNRAMMKPHAHRPEIHNLLESELKKPTLYHVALKVLEQDTGTRLDPNAMLRDKPHECREEIVDAWTMVYRDPKRYWTLYELAEKLVDLEDYFRRWRFNHVTTVERVIGFKRGSGGTSGVGYLQSMLKVELFPELWKLRGAL